jgi:hemerythrin
MSIDNGLIDNAHKCLINIVNDLDVIHADAGMPRQVTTILDRLNQYAQSHFQREERLQQAVGYKLSEAHHHRHRALTHELDAMRAEWETPAHPRT